MLGNNIRHYEIHSEQLGLKTNLVNLQELLPDQFVAYDSTGCKILNFY